MSIWTSIRIGDLVNDGTLFISDGYRMKNEELGVSGIPFVRGGDIGHDGQINTITSDHIRSEYVHRLESKLTRPGDVAFITKGTVGRAGRIREGQPQVVFAPQVAYWRSLNADRISPEFIYYLVISKPFKDALDAVKTHGAMAADYVSISQQYDFHLQIPDISTQRDIASILCALDDKIGLNRRMNETLEAIAQALFKDWFVDFGPVRAKMDDQDPPGLAPEVAALFPGQMGDDGLPEGWNSGPLSSVIRQTTAGVSPEMTPAKLFLHFSIPAFDANGQPVQEYGSAIKSNKTVVPEEAILMSKLNPAIPRVWLVGNQAGDRICSTEFLVYTPKKRILRSFSYCQLLEAGFRQRLESMVSGTSNSHQRVSPGAILALDIVLPSEKISLAFHEAVDSLLERVQVNRAETQTLAALRDLLLPKLMSGELRVRDAEKLVEQAA